MDRAGVDEVEAKEDMEEDRVIEDEEDMLMEVGRRHIPRPRASITSNRIMADTPIRQFTQRHICTRRRITTDNHRGTKTPNCLLRFQIRNSPSRWLQRATIIYLIPHLLTILRLIQTRHTCKEYHLQPMVLSRTINQ